MSCENHARDLENFYSPKNLHLYRAALVQQSTSVGTQVNHNIDPELCAGYSLRPRRR